MPLVPSTTTFLFSLILAGYNVLASLAPGVLSGLLLWRTLHNKNTGDP